MGAFDLDYSHLRAVVEPDRIPVRGNEHRITRIAFDLFRLDDDKENLWQVQADDDGNEFLVRTYELPKEASSGAASEWTVLEDARMANLTVAYRGVPVLRLATSDFGASGQEEVRLLRDLLQEKLAEGEFAGRMLATLPAPKRAALAAAFPKLAADLPKVPERAPKDPLAGIEPMDPRKEWGFGEGKTDLPPPGDWEKHPKADDPWSRGALVRDLEHPGNIEEAKSLVPRVLNYLNAHHGKPVSLHDLYMNLDCNDIPLYLALHGLVKSNLVQGQSPYDEPSDEILALTGGKPKGHGDFMYSMGPKLQNADEGDKPYWKDSGFESKEEYWADHRRQLEEGHRRLQEMTERRHRGAIDEAVTIAKEMGHSGNFEQHELPMIVFHFHQGDAKAKEFLDKMEKKGYYGCLVGPGWAAVKLPGL